MVKCGIGELEEALKRAGGSQIVDVREPAEYEHGHISGARPLPLSALEKGVPEGLDRSRPLYIVCQSGARACEAEDRLRAMGFADLRVVEGGLEAWLKAGGSVVRGEPKVWDLQRQVRFAAGLLVLAGLLLGHFARPYWLWLAAFAGAGLVFSGLTGFCGMARLLARMPWNRVL